MSDPELPNENMELLARLDSWKEGTNPGPIIRWAAAHLRGCAAHSSQPAPDAGLRRAAEWLVSIHADDVTIPEGSALWEDLQSLKSALAALPQPGEPDGPSCERGGLGGGTVPAYSWCRTHDGYWPGDAATCDRADRLALPQPGEPT